VVLIHSPRLTYPQPFTLLLQMPIFWTIFGTFGSTEGTRRVSPRNGSLEQNAGRFIGS
jgi:hypothetical protein